ncbi:YqjF family protein [Streptomyces sp. NPDC127159]|uniref:YqjF family protein n=1 Tax=unclassified Streptomyces TaxID=2593676 RepID=UPI00364205D2
MDTYEGRAWVSLTPFVMAGVRPPGSPAALPPFAETNLRTYVRGRNGREGLWFLSIEVACPVMMGARVVGVPYHLGRLQLARHGDDVAYAGYRGHGGPSYRLTVLPGRPIDPTPQDMWLTSRWRAFTRRWGALWETPVEHEPWPLRTARLDDLEETLTRAAGLPPPADEPRCTSRTESARSASALRAPCVPNRGDRHDRSGGPVTAVPPVSDVALTLSRCEE